MKTHKTYYASALILALSLGVSAATNYTESQHIDYQVPRTFEDGDSIIFDTPGTGIYFSTGGTATVNGAITIEAFQGIVALTHGTVRAVLDLGVGSRVTASTGINMGNNATFSADNLTVVANGPLSTTSYGFMAGGTSSVNLGSNTSISSNAATALVVSCSGGVTAVSGLRVTSVSGSGIQTGVGITNLGTNGYVEAGGNALTVYNTNSSSMVSADNFTFKSTGYASAAVNISGGSANITNSNLDGYYAIRVSHTFNTQDTVTIDNGTLTSRNAAIYLNGGTQAGSEKTVNIINGSTVSADNGILLDTNNIIVGKLDVNFDGEGTVANGRILDGVTRDTTVTVSNGAVWNTTGKSDLNNLVLDGGVINYTIGSDTDKITSGSFDVTDGTINIGFTDEFAEGFFLSGGDFVFDLESTITNSTSNLSELEVNIATSSDKYKWDLVALENEQYKLTNFREIPEPAACAAIFGALALALAAYRRRK